MSTIKFLSLPVKHIIVALTLYIDIFQNLLSHALFLFSSLLTRGLIRFIGYCSLIWFPHTKIGIKSIKTLQNQFLKLVLKKLLFYKNSFTPIQYMGPLGERQVDFHEILFQVFEWQNWRRCAFLDDKINFHVRTRDVFNIPFSSINLGTSSALDIGT